MINPSFPREVLENAIQKRVFPGAIAHLSQNDQEVAVLTVGNFGYDAPFDIAVTASTIYDLASVSKMYTLAGTLAVLRENNVPLSTPLKRFFPAFDERIGLDSLMSHVSGISFAVQVLDGVAADQWIERIANAPLHDEPGKTVLYSCTNFFLLARVAEQLSGETFDKILETRLFAPLGLNDTCFAPTDLDRVAPTELHDGVYWRGIVHDEAARSWRQQLGTFAGNAGVFATAADVTRFAQMWTRSGEGILHPDDVARAFSTRWPENAYWRGLGFQIDATFYMSEMAPPGTAGHLGFTGPSLVLQPQQGHVAVILNNRVHPTRNGPERLAFHRAVAKWMFENTSTLLPS